MNQTDNRGLTAYNPLANGKPKQVFNDENKAKTLVEYDRGDVAEILYSDLIADARAKLGNK